MSATSAQNREILYRLELGESYPSIAAAVGVSRCTVANRRRDHFPDGVRRRDPADDNEACSDLWMAVIERAVAEGDWAWFETERFEFVGGLLGVSVDGFRRRVRERAA